jgi:hypothetical protein
VCRVDVLLTPVVVPLADRMQSRADSSPMLRSWDPSTRPQQPEAGRSLTSPLSPFLRAVLALPPASPAATVIFTTPAATVILTTPMVATVMPTVVITRRVVLPTAATSAIIARLVLPGRGACQARHSHASGEQSCPQANHATSRQRLLRIGPDLILEHLRLLLSFL